MDLQTIFWNADIKSMEEGYILEGNHYRCLICGQAFDTGEIYPVNDRLFTAEKMVRDHIALEHGSMFEHMLSMNKSYTSLSDNQKQVLERMHRGLTDKEIASELRITESTIRNYRYKFKEKEKQAKVFLAIMGALRNDASNDEKPSNELVTPHKGATQIDDRYNITEQDTVKTIKNHMDESGALLTFPSKEKKKIIVLREIAKNFSEGKLYSEKEINRILKRIYDDYALIRRYLIQYGYLDRNTDGSGYWVK